MGSWFVFGWLKRLLVAAANEWKWNPGKVNLIGTGLVSVSAVLYIFQASILTEVLDRVQIDTTSVRTVSDKDPLIGSAVERLVILFLIIFFWLACIYVSTWAEKYLRDGEGDKPS